MKRASIVAWVLVPALIVSACDSQRVAQPDAGQRRRDAAIESGEDAGMASDASADASDASHDAAVDGPLDAAEFCRLRTDKDCKFMRDCWGQDECADTGFKDKLTHSRCDATLAAFADKRIGFDPVMARACIDVAMRCSDAWPSSHPLCRRVFSGRVKDGQPCFGASTDFTDECATGTCEGRCPGVCTKRKQGVLVRGAACELTFDAATSVGVDPCGDGLYCFTVSNTVLSGKCAAFGAVGVSCDDRRLCAGTLSCVDGKCSQGFGIGTECRASYECAAGLVCTGPYFETKKVCAKPVSLGETCKLDLAACSEDAYCDPATLKCRALAKPGASCPETACADFLQCSPDSVTCVPRSVLGEACNSACAWPATCMNSECVARQPVGVACTSWGSCQPGMFCDESGVCAKQRGPGGACGPDLACNDATYCDTARAKPICVRYCDGLR